jgi:hypothetical protein
MENITDRCRRICGLTNGDCFIGNSSQLSCIADLLINNVGCISSLLEETRSAIPAGTDSDSLDEAVSMANDLMNWVKYLQITHDLRQVAAVTPPRCRSDLRQERRYPLPSMFTEYLRLEVRMDADHVPARLTNFSQRGLQFITPGALAPERQAHCRLSTDHLVRNSLSFTAQLMYCNRLDESYLVGGHITEVSSTADFNFFTSVIEFMQEVQGDRHA